MNDFNDYLNEQLKILILKRNGMILKVNIVWQEAF